LKFLFCSEVPRTFPTLTDLGVAIGSLAWGGGGSGRIPASRRHSRPEGRGVVELDHTLT
jgi:hypothetical protein